MARNRTIEKLDRTGVDVESSDTDINGIAVFNIPDPESSCSF
ncbi:MAG: hypothetical protein ACK526_18590 [Planctomyces sp.]